MKRFYIFLITLLLVFGISASGLADSVVLNTYDISNFTLAGQAPSSGGAVIFSDASTADVSFLSAAAPFAAAGTTVDIISTFQVTPGIANGVDAGFGLFINDGIGNKLAIARPLLINGVPYIGLASTGYAQYQGAYPAFVQAEWQAAPLTVHLRRWADGRFELLELNGVPLGQPAFLSDQQIPSAFYIGSISVGFGFVSAQATADAQVDEFRVFTVPEPSTLLLLGSGLAGLAVFRKRFKA